MYQVDCVSARPRERETLVRMWWSSDQTDGVIGASSDDGECDGLDAHESEQALAEASEKSVRIRAVAWASSSESGTGKTASWAVETDGVHLDRERIDVLERSGVEPAHEQEVVLVGSFFAFALDAYVVEVLLERLDGGRASGRKMMAGAALREVDSSLMLVGQGVRLLPVNRKGKRRQTHKSPLNRSHIIRQRIL